MALRNHDATHCGQADAELNAVRLPEGWTPGHPVITRDSRGAHRFYSACLVQGTPVAVSLDSTTAIQDLQMGDTVLAAGSDLEWGSQTVALSVSASASPSPFSVWVNYDGGELIVTPDHLFLVQGDQLVRADSLVPGQQQLLSSSGQGIVLNSIMLGTYHGSFYNIAVSSAAPTTDLSNHLLITNGVISADYAVQISQQAALADDADRPIVGTDAYIKRYGPMTPLRMGTSLLGTIRVSDKADSTESTFVPMEYARLRIPDNAASFIDEPQATELSKAALRPFTDPSSRAWTEYLCTHHKAFFPDVEFHVDWYNNHVNAYAWIENGQRHVALLGGLIRSPALEIEGLGLVLAHALGRHFCGLPNSLDNTMSCGGEADFYGVRNIMRKAWFGDYYATFTDKGIQQMAKFFEAAAFAQSSGAETASGEGLPPGPCRIETYKAAFALQPKPACAG